MFRIAEDCGDLVGMEELSGASVLSRETWIVRPRPKSPESLKPGTVLGAYQLGRALGQGAAGLVYEATHTKLGRRVALKLLRQELSQSPTAVGRFFAEARMVNAIKHDNIVQITDLVDSDPVAKTPAYYVMDLLEGETLLEMMQRGQLPLQHSLQILEQVASALAAAHEAGIVHRDIKPANIFVTTEGVVKLLDFGVARLSTEVGLHQVETKAGNIVGTPGYMAPEQSISSNVDARADIYALGVVLFELATHETPFDDVDLRDLIMSHREKPVPNPNAVAKGPRIPLPVCALIQNCMAKDPDDRPQDGAALKARLSAVRTRRSPIGYIAAAAAVFLIILAATLVFSRSPEPVELVVSQPSLPAQPTPPDRPEKRAIANEAAAASPVDEVTLTVSSEPAGAQIEIDGKPVGVTPYKASVPNSDEPHLIELSLPGYVAAKKEVRLTANQDISIALAKLSSRNPRRTRPPRRLPKKTLPKRRDTKSVSPTRILNPFEGNQ